MEVAKLRALIIGVSGQDGSYLADLLLSKGYQVFGTSRDANISKFAGLSQLGIRDRLSFLSVTTTDFRSILSAIIQTQPDEIYNLSGQSSVGLSFDLPVETMESISVATLNLLEAVRFLNKPIRIYNAGSSECFGDTRGYAATEDTPFRPRSPYATAKAAAHFQVANYREAYKLFACTGILFNHESPLRPERFVTRKIIAAACRIAAGSDERLRLGNITIRRDWGWAPDYVEAMWRMLQQDHPEDFVIGTGVTVALSDFVCEAFAAVDLDWREHVEADPNLHRPTDLFESRANPEKAERLLGWRSSVDLRGIIQRMVVAERVQQARSGV